MEQKAPNRRVAGPVYGGEFLLDDGSLAPFVLPGELVAPPGVTEERRALLESSAHRTEARCIHFGICGGCQYQHAEPSYQLALKQEILRNLLQKAGLEHLPPIETVAGEPWEYRNRIRLRVRAGEAAGEFELGYSRAGTNQFLPITMCPIAAPVLWRAAEGLKSFASHDRRAREWLARTREVELFASPDQSCLQMQLFLGAASGGDGADFQAFCKLLQSVVPELAGAGAEMDPALPRRVRRGERGESWGAPGLNYPVGDHTYWVSRGAFFQVNRFLLPRLVSLVTAAAAGEGAAWDLYAGVGLFTRPLAQQFRRVVAVEGSATSAADLSRAGRVGSAWEAVNLPVLDFLRGQQTQRERPEVVVLDPPRAGVGEEGASLLARLRPAGIVYISCDPQTLARDLRVLAGAGYRLQTVSLVDLFPQTFHLETVVSLTL